MTDRPAWKEGLMLHAKCSACGLMKMPEDFLMMESTYDPKDPDPQVCDNCRKYGPPLEDPIAGLNMKERKAMLVLASGGSHAAASRASGIDAKTLRESLAGTNNSSMRSAFSRLMVEAGLGPEQILTALKDGLGAHKQQWDPKKGQFVPFADHASRLNAVRTVIKLHDLEPPKETPAQAGKVGLVVNFNTNIGSGQPQEQPGHYSIEVEGTRVDE